MRPIKLELEAFTCFRERQVVPFDGLSLFAIAGPTGSGKSSLLDAMVLALYGYVPRIGKTGLSELISLGEDKASVLLEFEVGDQRWRVARVIRRQGPTWAQLERMEKGFPVGVADKVRDVDTRIESILGLGCEAFLRSVLLPQGQFSAFLQSTPTERQQILTELLRTGVYDKMRARAEQEKQQQETRLAQLTRLLEEDFAGVTPEAVASAAEATASARERLQRERTRLPVLEERARELRARFERWGEVDKIEAEWGQHQARRDAIDALKRSVEAATRAQAAWPALSRLRHAQESERAATLAVEAAARAERDALGAHQQAEIGALEVEQRALELPALRERSALLSEAMGWSARKAAAALRGEDHHRAAEQARASLAETDAALAALSPRLQAATASLQSARQALLDAPFEPAELAALEASRDTASALTGARRQHATLSQEKIARGSLRQQLSFEVEGWEKERQEAEEALAQAVAAMEAATAQVRAAEHAELAHVLREGLAPGQSCPVCLQAVSALPELPPPASVHDARAAQEQAQKQREQADARHRQALSLVTNTRTRLALALEEEARTERALSELSLQIQQMEAQLDAAVPGPGPAELRWKMQFERLTQRRDAHARAQAVSQQAEAELASAQDRQQRLLDQQRSIQSTLEREERLRDEAQQEVRELSERLAAAHIEDPAPERARIEARIEAVVQLQRQGGAQLAAAREALQVARARSEGAAAQRETALELLRVAGLLLAEAVARAGFKEAAELEAALLPEEVLRERAEQVRLHEVQEGTLAARLAKAREGLGTERVSEAELGHAEEEHREAKASLEAAIRAEEVAVRAHTDLSTRLARAREHAAERDQLQGSVNRYRRLSADLRTNAFQAWLLSGAFSALVAGASIRLREFTGRYTLAWNAEKREIGVVDHDNADEIRRAETLSGGEMFLASLALALELSEQVQRAYGSVRLDSLFIDEGFGTLDPDTLDAVTGAIEALSATERMVGIITHVGSLTERLPARLEVRRRTEGSTVIRVE